MEITKTLLKLLVITVCLVSVTACTTKKENANHDTVLVEADSVYKTAGNKIVAMTFDTLRQSLLKAIGERGIENAISYCRQEAYHLTDVYGDSVEIRRTALRYRNPDNRPDSLELSILLEMTKQKQSSGDPGIQLLKDAGKFHFFKPIIMQPMCLNCHGIAGKDITPATLTQIRQLYPTDSAVNFNESDLRGVWHLVFQRQAEPIIR